MNFCHVFGKKYSKGFKKEMDNNNNHFEVGKLYRLTRNYFWFSNDIDWNDATDDQLLGKDAKVGDTVVFVDFKPIVSWGKKYIALCFVSADQGGLVHMALSSGNWELFFERIPDDDL